MGKRSVKKLLRPREPQRSSISAGKPASREVAPGSRRAARPPRDQDGTARRLQPQNSTDLTGALTAGGATEGGHDERPIVASPELALGRRERVSRELNVGDPRKVAFLDSRRRNLKKSYPGERTSPSGGTGSLSPADALREQNASGGPAHSGSPAWASRAWQAMRAPTAWYFRGCSPPVLTPRPSFHERDRRRQAEAPQAIAAEGEVVQGGRSYTWRGRLSVRESNTNGAPVLRRDGDQFFRYLPATAQFQRYPRGSRPPVELAGRESSNAAEKAGGWLSSVKVWVEQMKSVTVTSRRKTEI